MVFLITKSVCASVKLTEKKTTYVYTIMRKNSSCIWKIVSIPWSQTETTNHNIIQCTLLYHKLDRPLGTAAEVRSPFLSLELDKQVVSSHPCKILILFMILLHVSPISILRIWQMLFRPGFITYFAWTDREIRSHDGARLSCLYTGV